MRRVELYIRVPERWCQEIAHAGRAIVEIVHSLEESEFLSPAAASFWCTPTYQRTSTRPARLPQRKSEALASHQAALPTPARLPGLLPERLKEDTMWLGFPRD